MPIAAPLLTCLLLLASLPAAARDWYSAGYGDVQTRAFVVEFDRDALQALLPAPLALNTGFSGQKSGTHPVIFLFSTVMPRKAHLMPIYLDMPYHEFAAFIPEVTHPQLQGVFIHSLKLYLDSRMAVWIGQWPYRFPKIHAPLVHNEGTGIGDWQVTDTSGGKPFIETQYTLQIVKDIEPLLPALRQLDDWFSLPLINGKNSFTCSRMDWEITNHASLATLTGNINWRDDWLGDARRLPAPGENVSGIRLETRWFLSMPFDCDRYRRPRQRQ